MKDGIHIRAGVVRLLTLGVIALIGAAVARELPEIRRYIITERM